MSRPALAALALIGSALASAPGLAQDHSGPGHDHGAKVPPREAAPPAPAQPQVDDGEDTAPQSGGNEISPGPTMETPPPPEAGSGPPRAADAIWGADVMAAERHREHAAHGDFPVLWVQADRLEAQVRDGADGYLWDLQVYYGGPTSRFWFKSEGEGAFGEKIEQAEVQVLWSGAVAPYWDLQLGLRQDIAGPDTTHAVIGVQGLAPYMFEVDAALFISHRGDVTARVEAEIDQRITQRLILQPRVEAGFSLQDIPQLGIGAGLDKVELGLRLRYEITREFAPYIGVEQSWRVGGSADYARAAGEKTRATSFVAGLRFWF
ncbi:copper resistance protein B [Novosphingobium sp. TH158]|uniref:copper resistance protein B n=1 Tax=Novosphingobium sp. TH158 TaxID=2067455 RepID=UPI000C7A7A93|nr:copper resistance protein B [Novosphingobium sp. TH158]PLK24396.1 copper resistance protein CopB [Novosphingobium sp. TH158]